MPERRVRRDAIDQVPAGTPAPSVRAVGSNFATAKAGIGVCFARQGSRSKIEGVPGGSALGKALSRLMKENDFKAKKNETLMWHPAGRSAASRYLVIGLGSGAPDTATLRDACGRAARHATALGTRSLKMVVQLPASSDAAAMAEAATEGLALGSYRMTKYQTNGVKPLNLKSADVVVDRSSLDAAKEGVMRGTIRATATNMTRDIVNEPAMTATPARMVEIAKRVAKAGRLKIEVLEKRQLQRMKMGAILGVAAGSDEPPFMVHMTYRPKNAGKKKLPKIALVGKGITFDSGGLSLKPSSGMETMKLDKAGATAVLGAMSALTDLQPKAEVHGIMALTENMPSGSAIKPGDILEAADGQTIEVLNTDAEGRLILADALAYAQKQVKPDQIIDLATLTGACMVALGPTITGVFGNNQGMVDDLLAAADKAGEKMWQLPLEEDYAHQVKSDVADVRNTSTTRYGGAITAGLFLKNFVNDKMPWIHLDIAGPAFLEGERGFWRKGGTGHAVRTLLTYVDSLAN